jgi:hypothetical protein
MPEAGVNFNFIIADFINQAMFIIDASGPESRLFVSKRLWFSLSGKWIFLNVLN